MITDAKYIEQGFSREILDQLDPMNEGIIGDIINKTFKKNKQQSVKQRVLPTPTKDRIKINQEFVKKLFKDTIPAINRVLKKYPYASSAISVHTMQDRDYDVDDFINCENDYIDVASYDLWGHKDVKAQKLSARQLVDDNKFNDEFSNCCHEIDVVVSSLGYGECRSDGGDWDDGGFELVDIFDSEKYKEFESSYIKKHPSAQLESAIGEPEIANVNYTIKEVRDTDAFFNPSELETNVNDYESKMDGLSGSVFDNSGIVDTINNMVASILPKDNSPTDEAPCNNMIGCSDPDNCCCKQESFHSFNDNNLMHLSAYEAYLESCVENETKLHNALLYDLGVMEESSNNILLEVRIQDTVKNKWEVFKNFILRTKDRFQDSISNLLDKNRKFLEKYKDNIINTKPSEETKIEYNGNYTEAVNRCLNTPLPVFNYERDAQWLRQDGYEGAVKDFMAGKGIKYNPDDGGNLGDTFKNWFLAADQGNGTTKGSLASLNFKAMYDFCYNSNKIINSINRDIKAIDQSTNQLLNAVNKEVRERGENTNKNQATNPQQQTTTANNNTNSNQQQNNNQQNNNNTQTNNNTGNTQNESYVWMNINEADEKQTTTGLQIDDNNPQKKDDNGNTENNDNKPNQKTTTTEQDMTYITGKWINICRYFLTAKMTVVQQISKDYMDLIRIHLKNQNIKNFKDLNNEEPKGKVENNKENNNGQEKQGEEKGNNQQQ